MSLVRAQPQREISLSANGLLLEPVSHERHHPAAAHSTSSTNLALTLSSPLFSMCTDIATTRPPLLFLEVDCMPPPLSTSAVCLTATTAAAPGIAPASG
eukprot:m.223352 g.223352  ORF g.223352 m.223352 type:complete len:99 (-) comp33636_c0_seq1:661-957(-)